MTMCASLVLTLGQKRYQSLLLVLSLESLGLGKTSCYVSKKSPYGKELMPPFNSHMSELSWTWIFLQPQSTLQMTATLDSILTITYKRLSQNHREKLQNFGEICCVAIEN